MQCQYVPGETALTPLRPAKRGHSLSQNASVTVTVGNVGATEHLRKQSLRIRAHTNQGFECLAHGLAIVLGQHDHPHTQFLAHPTHYTNPMVGARHRCRMPLLMPHSCSVEVMACLNAGGKQMVDNSPGEMSLTGRQHQELPTKSSPIQGPGREQWAKYRLCVHIRGGWECVFVASPSCSFLHDRVHFNPSPSLPMATPPPCLGPDPCSSGADLTAAPRSSYFTGRQRRKATSPSWLIRGDETHRLASVPERSEEPRSVLSCPVRLLYTNPAQERMRFGHFGQQRAVGHRI
ncbi:hypothetical protein PAMA_004230 [Pampus argenteus]